MLSKARRNRAPRPDGHLASGVIPQTTHIDNLTGVQPATLARYRTYAARDADPVFGSSTTASLRVSTKCWRPLTDRFS
jgi:hypothetical protein